MGARVLIRGLGIWTGPRTFLRISLDSKRAPPYKFAARDPAGVRRGQCGPAWNTVPVGVTARLPREQPNCGVIENRNPSHHRQPAGAACAPGGAVRPPRGPVPRLRSHGEQGRHGREWQEHHGDDDAGGWSGVGLAYFGGGRGGRGTLPRAAAVGGIWLWGAL